ncbi:hypothetical protein KJ765_03435 [Candidatus Micrarchaeota archaeon]|nr:hypothetical protein [Candidatus Micrarchaeota archaeon]
MKSDKYSCENCKLEFDAEDPMNCPRCSSRKVRRAIEKRGRPDHPSPLHKERVAYSHQSFVAREGKAGWKDFHKTDVKACNECGSTSFELNWKHKEKVCKKCGSIYALPRRFS